MKLTKPIISFIVAILVLSLTVYNSHSSSSVHGVRSSYIIEIASKRSINSSFGDNFFNNLYIKLDNKGFLPRTTDLQENTPRDYLSNNLNTIHLITDFRSDDDNYEASVYTQKVRTPIKLSSKSLSSLANKISTYLTSKEAVHQRIKLSDNGRSKFQKHIDNGLFYFLDKNDINQAISEFKIASTLDPKSAIPHFNLALCYKRLGKYSERSKHINEGLKIDPNNWDLGNEKALLYINEGKYNDAINVLNKLPNDDPIYQWNLAYSYDKKGNVKQSKKILEELIKIDADRSKTFIADERLIELEKKEKDLAKTTKSMWVSLIGLLVILTISLITMLIKRINKETYKVTNLPLKDMVALRVQLGIALMSGLFSILSITLPKLL